MRLFCKKYLCVIGAMLIAWGLPVGSPELMPPTVLVIPVLIAGVTLILISYHLNKIDNWKR